MTEKRLSKSFFRKHFPRLLLVLLIPGFSAWFFKHAEQNLDSQVLISIERMIAAETRATEQDKQRAREFFKANPVSRIMASQAPDDVKRQASFEPVKQQYALFRWMQWLAWTCLAGVFVPFLLVGVSVALSFRSNAAQYWSLRIGWPILRTAAVIQVLGQAVLAVLLSYWVTALWMNVYVVKLIAIIGMLAAFGVWALIKAMFRKVKSKCEVSGQMLTEEDGPVLWQRIRDLAARLETPAPDRIVAGIEPSFYVTEHRVTMDKTVHDGRTLFVSLPMLKILSMEEADAVLGHELAHFSGQDTLWGRKISPLLERFNIYLQMLGTGIALPVALFLGIFWDLYMLSIRHLSRIRELRADQVGGALTTPSVMARALIKVTTYCEYRARTENSLIEHDRLHSELRLAEKLEGGFYDFLLAFTTNDKAVNSEIPHPFDTHPPLHHRLEGLGFNAAEALKGEGLGSRVTSTWYDAIPSAPAMEKAMWTERERLMQEFHSRDLAWRLLPDGAEEEALVLAHFPPLVFTKKDGSAATLTFDLIQLPEWNKPIPFKLIESASLSAEGNKKVLTLAYFLEEGGKGISIKFKPEVFSNADGNLLAGFERYFSRHKTALMRNKLKTEAADKGEAPAETAPE